MEGEVKAHRGLDTGCGANRIGRNSLDMELACPHTRTVIIARRDGIDYVECLDCRQIFEAEDLDALPVLEDEEQTA
jgi:hypothetical protein